MQCCPGALLCWVPATQGPQELAVQEIKGGAGKTSGIQGGAALWKAIAGLLATECLELKVRGPDSQHAEVSGSGTSGWTRSTAILFANSLFEHVLQTSP